MGQHPNILERIHTSYYQFTTSEQRIADYVLTQYADKRTRTVNLLITNQLLCQLSHIGIFRKMGPTGLEPVTPCL